MIYFYIVLIALLAFLVITFIRAAFFYKAKPAKKESFEGESVNEKRVSENLSRSIQFKTISDFDKNKVDFNEFYKFHDFLDEAYPLIHKNLEKEVVSEASLLYKWQGRDDSLEPIAFLAHQDVVPVSRGTEEDWEHPAFDGFNDGKFIWGRGALDMKNHLICLMESVETLLEEGYQPERTIYLCFGHNEEIVASPDSGAKAIAKVLESRGVRLDSVLDEGGAMLNVKIKGLLDANLTGVGVAEKGYADFKISVLSKGGHSSQAPKHTALGIIAKKVTRLENHQFHAKIQPFVYKLFNEVGKRTSLAGRLFFCNLWLFKPIICKAMTKIPGAASFVRTTTGVTMAQGSPAANILPQKASVTVNFRIMQGETIDDVRRHIEKYMGASNVEIELIKGKQASIVSPTDTKAFDTLKRLSISMNDKSIVAPYLVMGATDAYNYENVCNNIYRITPFTLDRELLLTTHSTNERIPVKQLFQGVSFFKRYIRIMTQD